MILTLVLLTSCGVQSSAEGTISGEDTDVKDVDLERMSLSADSVDELLAKIKDIKQEKETDSNNISTLGALIVPDFTIDGYYLMKIQVTKTSVFYYYTPLTVSRTDGFVDYDRDYVVTVRRSEYVNKSDPLQPLIDQLNLTPDEDGFIYDSEHRAVIFAYEDVWVSIRAPKGVNDYQTIKSLCSVKTLKLD